MKRLIVALGFSWAGALLASACVYDPDERCGPHQVAIDEEDLCLCEPGYVAGESGCVPCGAHETEVNGACLCEDGYARPSEEADCEPIPEALGESCDTESSPCSGATYPLCHATEGSSGYCTSSCETDSDCGGGYRCHQDGADSYCRRPPLGYLDSCESDEDCEGGEATFCETIRTHQCLVPCSAGATDVCFEGEVCCDFVLFQPICIPADACAENGTEVP